ncbi:hypothetical protein ACPCC1_06070, partial [Streptomyces pseudogriseolus]
TRPPTCSTPRPNAPAPAAATPHRTAGWPDRRPHTRQGPAKQPHSAADIHADTGARRTVTARLRPADEAADLLHAQAERSRTGRRDAPPDRWMA